ncbi:hypothetical protein LCGC14_3040380 [marine sediment metagenome]|uniref:Uncharacterized protein n=1 Tax=marine sediment metagenome TaxID=412755 RepID=A0A0F8ZFR4_9ZZZZ
MGTIVWVVLIIMSPFILVAALLVLCGLVVLAGAVGVVLSEAWENRKERKRIVAK